MKKLFKFTITFLLLAMTAVAILLLISEPKDLGSYAATAVCVFFDVVGFFAMYHKSNKLYIALHDPTLGEEVEND